MPRFITANELKTKGISSIARETSEDSEVIITVHGKEKYVVIPIEKYHYLREYKLEAALQESIRDLEQGNYVKEPVEEHIKRITRG